MEKKIECFESTDTFKLSLGGANTIDAEIFTSIMNDIIALVKEALNVVEPNCFARMDIRATEPGSFVTIIDTIVKYSPNLFNAENLAVATHLIEATVGFIEIKKHLKGTKPKSITPEENNLIIKNSHDECLIVPEKVGNAYFQNNTIQKLIINIVNKAEEGDRDNIALITPTKNLLVNNSEYKDMATSIDTQRNNIVTQEPFPVKLPLKKADFVGDSKWEFIFNKVISVKIIDEDFMRKVRTEKLKLCAGMIVPCLLKVECEMDEKMNTTKETYTITKVTGDLIEPESNNELFK